MISDIIKASGGGGGIPTAGDNWVFEDELIINTTNIGEISIYSGCYANGLYVVVGAGGKCATSTDGITWTANLSFSSVFSSNIPWYIMHANNMFLVVGSGSRCVYSTDGITWVQSGIPISGQTIYSAAYGNGRFVVVGSGAGVSSSVDGITWSRNDQTSYFGTSAIKSITFGDGKFIAVGDLGRSITSTDGINWEPLDISNRKFNNSNKMSKIKYLNGKYFAIGNGSLGMTSSDGINWEIIPSLQAIFNDYYIGDIIYDGNKYVAVGYSKIAISIDGIKWTPCNTPVINFVNLNSIVYYFGTYLTVGDNGKAYFSNDNTNTWIAITTLIGGSIKSVIHDGTKFIAVGDNNVSYTYTSGSASWSTATATFLPGGTWDINDIIFNNNTGLYLAVCNSGKLGISSDFNNWTVSTLGNGTNLTSIKYFNNEYYVTGAAGFIFKSSDGITWTQTSITNQLERNISGNLIDICYSGNNFISALDTGMAVSSPDGINWESYTNLTDNIFGSNDTLVLKYLNNKFVALSNDNKIAFSDDGTKWVKAYDFKHKASTKSIYSITYGNGLYVAVGQTNACLTSPDGVTWTYIEGLYNAFGISYNFKDIEFKNGLYVAVGFSGKIATSTDGVTWTTRNSNTSEELTKIIYTNGKFVATGNNSSVYSTDGITWLVSSNYTTLWGSNTVHCLTIIDGTIYNTGNNGKLIKSSDGITWVEITSHMSISGSTIRTFFKTNNLYHIYNSSNICLISTDTVTWTVKPGSEITSSAMFTSVTTNNTTILAGSNSTAVMCLDNNNAWFNIYGLKNVETFRSYINIVKYLNGKFVIGGNNSSFASSDDGVTWEYGIKIRSKFGYGDSIKDIAYFNGKYIVVGTGTKCVTSTDAINWSLVSNFYNALGNLYTIYFLLNDGTSLYAFSELSKYVKSTDFELTNWEYKDSLGFGNTKFNGATINTICDDGNIIIVSGNNGKCVTSTDGVNWTLNNQVKNLSGGIGYNVSASICTKDLYTSKFILFVTNGPILTSVDGVNWEKINNNLLSIFSTFKIAKVIYINGLYIVVGNGGRCAVSYDCVNWSDIPALKAIFGTSNICDIIYANGKYIAVGAGGKCATSTDAITWTLGSNVNFIFGTSIIYNVEYGNGLYVMVGASGKCGYSIDGITWSNINMSLTYVFGVSAIYNLIFDGVKFVAVGQSGKYAYSYDGMAWNGNTSFTNISNLKNYWVIHKTIMNNTSVYLAGGDSGYLLESFGQ